MKKRAKTACFEVELALKELANLLDAPFALPKRPKDLEGLLQHVVVLKKQHASLTQLACLVIRSDPTKASAINAVHGRIKWTWERYLRDL